MAEFVLRIQHNGSMQDAIYSQFLTAWANQIETQSGGRIEVEIFTSGQLTPPSEILSAVQSGILDAGIVALDDSVDERFSVFQIPFTAGANEASAKAAWNVVNTHLAPLDGVKALATFVTSVAGLQTNQPIAAPGELAGVKIGTLSGDPTLDFLSDIGASPVRLPLSEMYGALAVGVIDAATVPLDRISFIDLNLQELVQHAHVFEGSSGFGSVLNGFVINEDFYQQLPADLKQVIDQNSGLELSAHAGRVLAAQAEANVSAMERAGMTVTRFDSEQTETWREAAQPISDQIATDVSSAEFDAKEVIEQLADNGPKLIFVAHTSAAIDTVGELDAATVSMSAEDEAVVYEFLTQNGITYQPLVFETLETALEAFEQGRADVFVTLDREMAEAAAARGGHYLFSSTDLDGSPGDPGTDGPDYIVGTAGTDAFQASGGNDTYDGQSGYDSITYDGPRANFVVQVQNDGSIRVEKSEGEFDTLLSIERIDVVDGAYLYDINSPIAEFTYRIYAAAYGRTPDEDGLRFWTGVMDEIDGNQPSLDKHEFLANKFLKADEYLALYGPAPSNLEYIDAMYQNVLGRPADQEGYQYWVQRMQEGADRGDILQVFSESEENKMNTAPDLSDGLWVI